MGLSMSPLSNMYFVEGVGTDTLKTFLSLGTNNISVEIGHTGHEIPE